MGFSAGHSTRWLSLSIAFRSDWNLECWFLLREENGRTQRETRGVGTRTNNKLNACVTPGLGVEPRPQQWEASTPTTAPSLLHPHSLLINLLLLLLLLLLLISLSLLSLQLLY